jgi:outer membrane immunogenic protein
MKRILIGVAGVWALLIAVPASIANAADMPVKAPAIPAPAAPSWAGLYVGINGGYGWDQTTWTFPTLQFFDTAAGQAFATHPKGGIAGGQIGYNVQTGAWVFGAELTGDWADLSQTLVGPVTPIFPSDTYTTKLQDLETITVRVGYAPGSWLFYAKGGAASGSVRLNAISGVPVAGEAFSSTQRQLVGATAGGGIEYMLTPHFIVGIEYDYVALDGATISTTAICTNAATCGGTPTTPVSVGSNTFRVQSVLGRVSYKF